MDKNTIKSTISELLKLIDEQTFLKLNPLMNLDKYTKKLTTYKLFQLLIIAQLYETESLTRNSKQTKDKDEIQKQVGFDSISTAQLSQKLSQLPSKLFERTFQHLAMKVQSQLTCHSPVVRDISRLHVIDSSTMSMSLSQYPWARFRKTKAGVRLHLHVVVTKELTIPDKAIFLPVVHSDRSQMSELIDISSDTLYLFDRGYNDYK